LVSRRESANVLELAQLILENVYFPEYNSDRPLVGMAQKALRSCPWNQVYDAAERIYAYLVRGRAATEQFERNLNFLFRQEGIGGLMVDGVIPGWRLVRVLNPIVNLSASAAYGSGSPLRGSPSAPVPAGSRSQVRT
jgi:hypothetical protein